MAFSSHIPLNAKKIARCRQIAKSIGNQVADLVHRNSTVGTERAVLRLLGFNEALAHEGLLYPVSNFIVDQVKRSDRLHEGALYWIANALVAERCDTETLQKKIIAKDIDVGGVGPQDKKKVTKLAEDLSKKTRSEEHTSELQSR